MQACLHCRICVYVSSDSYYRRQIGHIKSAKYGTYDSMMPRTLGASLAISATSSLSKSIPPATGGKLYMTLSPTRLADSQHCDRRDGSVHWNWRGGSHINEELSCRCWISFKVTGPVSWSDDKSKICADCGSIASQLDCFTGAIASYAGNNRRLL